LKYCIPSNGNQVVYAIHYWRMSKQFDLFIPEPSTMAYLRNGLIAVYLNIKRAAY